MRHGDTVEEDLLICYVHLEGADIVHGAQAPMQRPALLHPESLVACMQTPQVTLGDLFDFELILSNRNVEVSDL